MTHAKGNGKPQGFQFPGSFEVTAVGRADAELEVVVPALVAGTGADVITEKVRTRPSREGRFMAVTVECTCATRQQYESVHEALRAHADIRYTL